MPNTHTTLTSLFDDIADAIREKTGSNATIAADDFPTAISSISSGPSDGRVWTSIDIPVTSWGRGSTFHISDIAYGNGKYVLLVNTDYFGNYGGSDPTKVLYSEDLTHWTTVTLSGHYDGIAYGVGRFLLLESGGDEQAANLAYSTDLVNWTYTTSGRVETDEMEMWYAVKCIDGLFIISGDYLVMGASIDLANWSYITGDTGDISYTMAGDDGRAIDASDGLNFISFHKIQQIDPNVSLIGSHEFETTSGKTYGGWHSRFCGNGRYFAVLEETEYVNSDWVSYFRVFSTTDGVNWTDVFLTTEPIINCGYTTGVYGNGKYMINMSNKGLYISTDCVNWEFVSGTPMMDNIKHGNGAFFGEGISGTETSKVTIYYSRTTNDY